MINHCYLSLFFRTNSGTNGSSSATTISHGSSPKNPNLSQPSSTKTPLSGSSQSHFTYPITTTTSTTTTTTTQPVLQYSTIVSQNTLPSTSTGINNSVTKQQSIFSPQSKQMSRQTSVSNDSTVPTTSSQTILSSSSSITTTAANVLPNSSHPPSLLSNNDRTGNIFYNF